jgi:hypothetical protein
MLYKSRVDYNIGAGLRGPDFAIRGDFADLPYNLKYLFTARIRSLAISDKDNIVGMYRDKQMKLPETFNEFVEYCQTIDSVTDKMPLKHFLSHVSWALRGLTRYYLEDETVKDEIERLLHQLRNMRLVLEAPTYVDIDRFSSEWAEFCEWCNDGLLETTIG